jgi:hypothetical protein
MIHLNKGEGIPHEWITNEEFESRYPQLAKLIKEPVDENEHGQKLKAMRVKRRLTIRALSQATGFECAEICDFESGRKNITPEINDRYCIGLNKAVRQNA